MKKLIYKEGNLLLANDIEIIGHQANCQNTFGSGIARTIKELFPEAYNADCIAANDRTNKLGEVSFAKIEPNTYNPPARYIFNLYGQNLYGKGIRQTDYEALYSALEKMHNIIKSHDHFINFRDATVGFPYQMGSFRGGGSWDIVSRLIEVAFDGYAGDVIIYKLDAN